MDPRTAAPVRTGPLPLSAWPARSAGPARAAAAETVLAAVIAASTFLVHDVGRALSQSYWLDEAWVAVSTREPVSQAPFLTSSSPLGWTVLLRAVVVGGPERQRVVPLALLGVAAVLAYLLGRRSPLPSALGGSLAAVAVVLLPHALIRNDLKQYSADAAAALLLLLLTTRADEARSSRRLAVLAALAPVVMLVSSASALVTAACFVGLLGAALARRERRWALAVLAAGAGAAAGLLLVYAVAVRPHVTTALEAYWRGYYLPVGDPGAAAGMVAGRWSDLQRLTNLGPWWCALLLAGAGLLTLARSGRAAVAVAVPALVLVLGAASALHRYPFLDQRTSLFLFVVLAVVAAVGVAGLAAAAAAALRSPLAAGLVVVVAVAAYSVVPLTSYLRVASIPVEDVAAATAWVDARARPSDAVVVSFGAQYGYAYYSRRVDPELVPDSGPAIGFVVASDATQWLTVAADRPAGLRVAVRWARDLLGPGGRVYVLSAHLHRGERATLDALPAAAVLTLPGARVTVLAPPRER